MFRGLLTATATAGLFCNCNIGRFHPLKRPPSDARIKIKLINGLFKARPSSRANFRLHALAPDSLKEKTLVKALSGKIRGSERFCPVLSQEVVDVLGGISIDGELLAPGFELKVITAEYGLLQL